MSDKEIICSSLFSANEAINIEYNICLNLLSAITSSNVIKLHLKNNIISYNNYNIPINKYIYDLDIIKLLCVLKYKIINDKELYRKYFNTSILLGKLTNNYVYHIDNKINHTYVV